MRLYRLDAEGSSAVGSLLMAIGDSSPESVDQWIVRWRKLHTCASTATYLSHESLLK
jgi:hypothetical protein